MDIKLANKAKVRYYKLEEYIYKHLFANVKILVYIFLKQYTKYFSNWPIYNSFTVHITCHQGFLHVGLVFGLVLFSFPVYTHYSILSISSSVLVQKVGEPLGLVLNCMGCSHLLGGFIKSLYLYQRIRNQLTGNFSTYLCQFSNSSLIIKL